MSVNWTPRTRDDFEHLTGYDVFSADGERLGSVADLRLPDKDRPLGSGEHFLKLDGDADIFVPGQYVARIDPEQKRIDLRDTRAELEARDWSHPIAVEQDDDPSEAEDATGEDDAHQDVEPSDDE